MQRIKETAERHATLMEASSQSVQAESALFEDDDEEEDGQINDANNGGASNSKQREKSLKKTAPVFEGVEENASGHCIQTVKELQNSEYIRVLRLFPRRKWWMAADSNLVICRSTVPVIVSADLNVCPPVIKVFAVNPFA